MSVSSIGIPTWSPGLFADRQKIPRRYLRVQRDQQELLDREDAWSPDGFPNVPAEVLQEVKAQYIRSIAPPRKSLSPVAPSETSVREDQEPDEPSTPRPTSTGTEEGTPIPWSPSPEHHIRPVTPVNDEDPNDGTPGPEPSPEVYTTPKETIATPRLSSRALPERLSSQKRPTEPRPSSPLVFKVKARVPFVPEFPPSSSVASEGGLDFEVPKAVTDVLPSVNKGALPVLPVDLEQGTPPSAQIIPASYLARTTPSRPPPEKRRRIMAKSATTIYSDYKSTTDVERSSAVVPRAETETPSMTRVAEYIPGTQQHSGEQQSTDTSSHPPKSTRQATQHLASSDEKIPPNGPPSQVPYVAFKVAYPDYKGSPNDFVGAVLCVHDLRKRSAIMEFLYDDFVRFYCEDYLQYLGKAGDGSSNVPVRAAIELYNDEVSRPQYHKGVLTKENIKDVLDKYSKIVRSIQNKTLGSSQPVTINENGESSRPKTPVIPSPSMATNHPLKSPIASSPSTANHPPPKPLLVSKSIRKSLGDLPRVELASDPIHPPSSIPQKRPRPVTQTIDRSVPRRLSNRPLELEPPLEDEPVPPGSDAAAPIEIDSAQSSSSPSPSPPPVLSSHAPGRSQGGPSSSATKVIQPQEQRNDGSLPGDASASLKRPQVDTCPQRPPPSLTRIATQEASISPPPPRRSSKVDVSSPAILRQPLQQENMRTTPQIVPGTPAPAPAPSPAPSPAAWPTATAAPSPSLPLITQVHVPAPTNFTNTNTNLPLLSQVSNADSIPEPSAPSFTTRSKPFSSTATSKTKMAPPPLPPPPIGPADSSSSITAVAATVTHLINQDQSLRPNLDLSHQIPNQDQVQVHNHNPNPKPSHDNDNPFLLTSITNHAVNPPLSTQISNADSIPEPSLPPRLQRQRKSSAAAASTSSTMLTSSNLSRLAHITSSSKRFLQKKAAATLGAGAPPSSSASASGSSYRSGSRSGSVVPSSSAVSRVSTGGGVVKVKAKDVKGKGKAKSSNRDLRAEYFVNFIRDKKAREAREAAEKVEREEVEREDARGGSSHLAPGSSTGQQAR